MLGIHGPLWVGHVNLTPTSLTWQNPDSPLFHTMLCPETPSHHQCDLSFLPPLPSLPSQKVGDTAAGTPVQGRSLFRAGSICAPLISAVPLRFALNPAKPPNPGPPVLGGSAHPMFAEKLDTSPLVGPKESEMAEASGAHPAAHSLLHPMLPPSLSAGADEGSPTLSLPISMFPGEADLKLQLCNLGLTPYTVSPHL